MDICRGWRQNSENDTGVECHCQKKETKAYETVYGWNKNHDHKGLTENREIDGTKLLRDEDLLHCRKILNKQVNALKTNNLV